MSLCYSSAFFATSLPRRWIFGLLERDFRCCVVMSAPPPPPSSQPPPPPSSQPPPPPPSSQPPPPPSHHHSPSLTNTPSATADLHSDVDPVENGQVARQQPSGGDSVAAEPPSSLEEAIAVFREFAQFYDVDLQREPYLLQVIQEASAASLPDGWEEIEKDDEEVYFYNKNTKESTWEHPLDAPTRSRIAAEREKHMGSQNGRPPAGLTAYVSSSVPDLSSVKSTGDRLSQKDLLTLPTSVEGDTRTDQANNEQIRRVTAELESVTRARDAESRERELLKDMVEQVRQQLADGRAEAKTQRETISGLEKSRQELWTRNIELQGRLTTAEAQGREAERERDRLAEKVSELDKLVVTSQTKLVVLEKELAQDKTAASYESAEKRRAQEGFHEINERYGKLLSKVQELESQLETERNHSVQARAQADAARQHAEYVQAEASRTRHRSKSGTKRVEMPRPATADLLSRPSTASYEANPYNGGRPMTGSGLRPSSSSKTMGSGGFHKMGTAEVFTLTEDDEF